MMASHELDLTGAFVDLASVDPHAYEGLGLDEVEALLRRAALAAGPARIRVLLDGPIGIPLPGTCDTDPVERYVARRLATIRRLRDLRTAFRRGPGK